MKQCPIISLKSGCKEKVDDRSDPEHNTAHVHALKPEPLRCN